MDRLKLFFFLALLVSAGSAKAYPDLIRHNYVNCTACHVAPTGGFALNGYGRMMSKELLSRWGGEREAEPLHGLLPEGSIPESLIVGGNVRILQVHRESPDRRTGRGFPMQAAIELGATYGRFTGVFSIGELQQRPRGWRPISTRFYGMWTARDELTFRAGRFVPFFGVMTPYHTLPTRQGLGLGPGGERDTFETVWSGESWNLASSVSVTPRGPVADDERETLATAQVNRNFLGSYRVGLSYLHGDSNISARDALGVHGLLGFNEKWAYVTEFTFQNSRRKAGGEATGLFHFSQLLYEVTKGVNLYFLEEYQKADLTDSATLVDAFGPGVRFFPRPHFELDFVFTKRREAEVADRYDDYAWLMLHYYF